VILLGRPDSWTTEYLTFARALLLLCPELRTTASPIHRMGAPRWGMAGGQSTGTPRRAPAPRPGLHRGAGQHALLDHLVRPEQERRRDRQAKRLGGLEVDDQFKLSRLLDWQVRRLGTLRITCFYLLRRSRKSAMNLSDRSRAHSRMTRSAVAPSSWCFGGGALPISSRAGRPTCVSRSK